MMICLAALLVAGPCTQESLPGVDRAADLSLEEKLLATAPAEVPLAWLSTVAFSADGRRVALADCSTSGHQCLLVNGIRGEEFDHLLGPAVFSQDGKVLAYCAIKDGTSFICLEGIRHEVSGKVQNWVVSPDGKRWACLTATGKPLETRFRVVVDGIPGEEFNFVDQYSLQFSPHSKRLAYKAVQNELMVAVIDGAKSPGYRVIFQILFIAGGSQVALLVSEGGNMGLVVDGKKRSEAFYGLTDVAFNPEGRLIGYIRGEKHQPDRAVIHGEPQEPFHEVRGLTFSPDGRRAAYLATLGPKQFVMVDRERIEGAGKSMWPGPFSPDGMRFACLAWDMAGYTLIVDGVSGETLELISSPSFSPDSRHVASIAKNGGKMFTVIDAVKGEEFDFVTPVRFSADSGKAAYGARKGRELWWKVREVPKPPQK